LLSAGGRDVFNEKPSLEDMIAAEGEAGGAALVLPRGVTIHTTKVSEQGKGHILCSVAAERLGHVVV
jgi:hypothetical protein